MPNPIDNVCNTTIEFSEPNIICIIVIADEYNGGSFKLLDK